MMDKDHVKQHYIPQFIIRKFCKSDGKIYYYDKNNKNVEEKLPKEIFFENNLYKYLYEIKEDPNTIEKDLSKFESIVAKLIEPFIEQYAVSLDYERNELLKYFFFIMMFRSKFMTATYNKNILNYNKQSNLTSGELDEFYRKNLGMLVRCRSLEDAIKDDRIDKQFIRYAEDVVFGATNKHLVLFESDKKIDFILGDVYPIGIAQPIDFCGVILLTCLVYPISYNRAIALVDTYSDFHEKMKQKKVESKDWYKEPKKFGEGYLIECNYLTYDFVSKINKSIFEGSIDGVCFRSGRKTGLSELE